jgi:hypothetical protein
VRERSHIQKTVRAPATCRECTQDSHSPATTDSNHRTVTLGHRHEIRFRVAVGSTPAIGQFFVTRSLAPTICVNAFTSRSIDDSTR